MADIKSTLYQYCLEFIEERIQTAKIAIEQAREASNDDTKSSAGDKYETSREMMQQDIDRNKKLLIDAEENLLALKAIKMQPPSHQVRVGSLVYTNQGIFYISISVGRLEVGEGLVFAISLASPIGRMLVGKKIGEGFDFNGKRYEIKAIA